MNAPSDQTDQCIELPADQYFEKMRQEVDGDHITPHVTAQFERFMAWACSPAAGEFHRKYRLQNAPSTQFQVAA